VKRKFESTTGTPTLATNSGPDNRQLGAASVRGDDETVQRQAILPKPRETFRVRFLSGNSILAQWKPLQVDAMGVRPASAHS
jgi:hypothetical protein